jgi:F0F1-type ATP synthase membrane subunit b/b'
MIVIFLSTILLLSETASSSGGFMKFYNDWLAIPGFELWKFVNLGIFIGIMSYLLRIPLGDKFKAKRDAIRADLVKAEEEKKEALARLTTIEARLAQLESEKQTILERAKAESEDERKHLTEQTRHDMARLRMQADAEIARLVNQMRAELRRFTADESIRLAEQKLRSQIGADTDARLVKASIREIGGLN